MDYTKIWYESPMPAVIWDDSAAVYVGGIVYQDTYIRGDNWKTGSIPALLQQAQVKGLDLDNVIIEYACYEYDLNNWIKEGHNYANI